MKPSRTRVVSLRIPTSEFIELVAEAEASNSSISEALLSAWRERKSRRPIETGLHNIETAIAEMRAENIHKFQRLADGLNQLIAGRK
jgi:hypothetical protein